MFGIENMISVQYMCAAKEIAAVKKAAKKEVENNFLEDPKQKLDEDLWMWKPILMPSSTRAGATWV